MKKIKLSIPGFQEKISLFNFLGNNENRFEDYCFYVNDSSLEEADFWFVIDDLNQKEEKVVIDSSNIIFLTAEHIYNKGYFDSKDKENFLSQFSRIYSSYDIFTDNAFFTTPFLPWMIHANHGSSIYDSSEINIHSLMNKKIENKEKILSVFCSVKSNSPGHYLRFKFVNELKKYFGDRLDWFGNGIHSLPRKWEGISNYKYHIVLENQSSHNIFSEKIYDAFLGEAFPIYWGAHNLDDYFSNESFAKIEISDWKGSIKKIESIIEKNTWEKSQNYILQSKQRVLNELNFVHRIISIIKNKQDENNSYKKLINLRNVQSFKGIKRRLFNRLSYELFNIAQYLKNKSKI